MHMPYLLLYVPYLFLVLALISTIFLSKYFAQLLFSKWQEENDPYHKVPELENSQALFIKSMNSTHFHSKKNNLISVNKNATGGLNSYNTQVITIENGFPHPLSPLLSASLFPNPDTNHYSLSFIHMHTRARTRTLLFLTSNL